MSVYEMKPIEYSERDVARFHRNYNINDEECWLWGMSLDKSGYGSMSIRYEGVQRTHRAHRVAYTMLVGPIPDGLTIDHLCRVRNCVNPIHLEPVTLQENIARIERVGRYVEECKWKHGEGSMVTRPSGYRNCNRCSVARQRAHRLGITTKEAIEREDELDITMTRKKVHNHNPAKPTKVFLDWSNPRTCLDCTTPIRRRQDPQEKGVLLHAGRGKCAKCLKTTLYGEKYNKTAYHVDNAKQLD